MMSRVRRVHRISERRGLMTLELLLAIPLLLVLLLGLFEFSLLFAARGEVVQAARAGARLASLNGVSQEEVESEVQRSLGERFGSVWQVDVQLGEVSGDEVSVTVRVPMAAAAPDLLWPIGYSLQNQTLAASTRLLKE